MLHSPSAPAAVRQRKDALLPVGVENGLVRFGEDRAETHHSSEVLPAVHAAFSAASDRGSMARPVPIIESRVTSAASRSSLQPSVPAGRIGHDQVADLGRRIPDADPGLGRQRNAEFGEHAARIDHGARTIGRGLVPDRRQAEHRQRDSRSRACRRPCCGRRACSRPRPCARPGVPRSPAIRSPRSRRRAAICDRPGRPSFSRPPGPRCVGRFSIS